MTNRSYVGPVAGTTLAKETLSKFSAFRLERQYGFCTKDGNYCALGTTTWGEIAFCADVALETHADDNEANTLPVTMSNLGERQDAGAPNVETIAPSLYAPKAEGFVFGAFGANPLEVTATDSLNLGQMRPENPCSTLGDEWYWDPDDRSRCKSSTGQTCQVNDWITCEGKQISGGTLHPIHHKIAKWPHRIYVDEIEREMAVFDLTREFGPRPLDLTALEAERDGATARAATLKREYEQLQADIDFVLPDISSTCACSAPSSLHNYNYHVGWGVIYGFWQEPWPNHISDNIFWRMQVQPSFRWEKGGVPNDWCRYTNHQDGCIKIYEPVDWITGNVWPNSAGGECGQNSTTWNTNPYVPHTSLYVNGEFGTAETQCLGIKQAFDIMKEFKEKIEEDIAVYLQTYADCLSAECDYDWDHWFCEYKCGDNSMRSKLETRLLGVQHNYEIAVWRYSQALVSVSNKKIQEAAAKMEAEIAQQTINNALEGETCTPEVPCDICESNCEHDNECKSGLVCNLESTDYSLWEAVRMSLLCKSPPTGIPSGVKFCIPEKIEDPTGTQLHATGTTGTRFYVAGYLKDESMYATTILEVHKETGEILQEFAATEHAWSNTMKQPSHSGSLLAIRASQDINANFDNMYYTTFGWLNVEGLSLTKIDRTLPFRGKVYSGGIAGTVIPPSYSLHPNNQERGVLIQNQNELVEGVDVCTELCEKTPGCTFAEEHLGGLQGVSHYTVRKESRRVCMLYDNPVPEDFACDAEGSLVVHPCECDTEPATALGYKKTDWFYKAVDSGTCETHGFETITQEAQCRTAALYFGLGLKLDNQSSLQDIEYYPAGCVSFGAKGLAAEFTPYITNWPDYRNMRAHTISSRKPPCGTQGSPGNNQCLCKVSAGGVKLEDFKVSVRRPDGCGICKSRGMAQSNFANSTSKGVLPQCGDAGENVNCSPFPKASGADYTWESSNRCPPARAAANAYTALTRIGQSFRTSNSDPYTVFEQITFFSECEALCISSTQSCRAWYYYEQTMEALPVRRCELFDYVPDIVTTISGDENVFSATERIGTVERDYGGRIMLVDEEKSNAACLCDDDSPGGGYDCGCVASLATPFLPETPTDNLYGCNGKGVCLGTTYGCACEGGYEWSRGDTLAGWTCRPCTAGKYKDAALLRCVDCPYGKFTHPESFGLVACLACPFGKTTFSPGVFSSEASCDDCPAGRIGGDQPGKCQGCPTGKYEAQVGKIDDYTQRECKDCAIGFTTSSRGASECDVALVGCDQPGKGWQTMSALGEDSASLGNARCADCGAGKYSTTGAECLDCPTGKYQGTTGASACANCEVGRYSGDLGHRNECFKCPKGRFQPQEGAEDCKNCTAGKYQDTTGASACANCEVGRYSGDLGHRNECFKCPKGRFQPQEGAEDCENCTAGKYGITAGAQEAAACVNCEVGRYSGDSGLALSFAEYEYVTKQTFYEGSLVRNFGVQGADCAAAGLVAIQTLDECMAAAQTKNSAVVISTEPVSETDQSPLPGCYLVGDPEGTPTAMFNPGQEDRHCGYRLEANNYGICLCARERQSPCSECPTGKYGITAGAQEAAACANCEVGRYSGDSGLALSLSFAEYEYVTKQTFYEGSLVRNFGVQGADCAAAGLVAIQTLDECMAAAQTKNSAVVISTEPVSETDQSPLPGCYLVGDPEGTPTAMFNPGQEDRDCGYRLEANNYGICLCARERQSPCSECPKGRFQPQEGAEDCKNCTAGKYQDTTGASACANCEVGRYSGDLGHRNECSECPKGRFQPQEGAEDCKNCTAGKYGITAGAQEAAACANCEVGRYSGDSGLALSFAEYEYVTKQTFYEGSLVRNFGVQGADCAAAGLVAIQTLDECMAAAQTKNSAVVISTEPVSETDQYPLPGCYLVGDPEGTPTAMFNPGQEGRHCGYRLGANNYGICLCARERQSPCSECPKGRFQAQGGAEVCKYCTTGKYQDTTGASACANCEVGRYSGDLLDGSRVVYEFKFVESGADCAAAGLPAIQTLDECMAAARTKNSEFIPSTEPLPEDLRDKTPPGCYLVGDLEDAAAVFFNPGPTDVACGATMNFFGGNFSQTCLCGKGETTVFTCPTCAVGTYQDEEGTSACKNCAAGTYQDTTRMAACLECPKGRFQTQGGAEDCDACPTGWDSSTETGSVNCVLTPTTAAPTTAAPI